MTGQIITVRHGRPALSRRVIFSANGYGEWWQKYDEGGLYSGQTPPDRLMEAASTAVRVYASIMPRAIETAEMIAGDKSLVKSDPLFVEAPLPPPPWPDWLKLSPRFWGVISRLYWNFGYVIGDMETKDQAWVRVDRILDKLIEDAASGDVVMCAHGYLNWMIARRANARGIKCREWHGGNKYWSFRRYDISNL